ncbi:MAG: dihydrodipicolinate synthase family protein [Acidimicrobiales bacterium]
MSTDARRGIVGTPVTPFTEAGDLDTAALERLVDFHVAQGSHLLAMPMHIGESLDLTTDERKTLAEVAVKTAGGRVPVFVNASLAGTAQVIELARHAESVGADGIVVITPYHWRPGPDALLAHFSAVAGAVGIDVLLYNFPARLGVTITPDLLARLVERCPNVVGMKDAAYDMKAFTEIVRRMRGTAADFHLFTGVEYPLPGMVLGAHGCFSPSLQIAPGLVRSLYESCAAGDYAGALPLQQQASALWQILKSGHAAGVKAALDLLGRPAGGVRLPMLPFDGAQRARLESSLRGLGVLDGEPVGW